MTPVLAAAGKNTSSAVAAKPDPAKKIALFGGTFDPIHNAHLAITGEAQQICGLDTVLFIPCWQSPHKREMISSAPEHRLAMLRLATQDLLWAEISTWELDRREPSYSWMTARHFAEEFPGAELHWILGADQWNVIDTWVKPEILAELLTFIVFPRNGVDPIERKGFRRHLINIETPGSSTQIRENIANGLSINQLVSKSVASYIVRNDLYKPS